MENLPKPKINLHTKYASLFNNDWRYAIIRGGRASGKSHAVNAWAVMLTFEKGHKILHTRYTASSTKDSIVADVKSRIEEMGLNEYFHITRDRITNTVTDSEILFKGLKAQSGDEKARLKSVSGVTTLIIEEAEDLRDEDDFDVVDLSIRGSKEQPKVRTVFLLNPTDVEHFIYKRWFNNKVSDDFTGVKDNSLYILANWEDVSAHLPSSLIANFNRMKKDNPERYKNVVEGAWLHQRDGVIYSPNNWKVGEYKKTSNSMIGIDFGFKHPTAIIEVSVDHELRTCWAKELCYESGMLPEDMFKFIVRNKLVDDEFVADSSRPEIIEELSKRGQGMIRIEPSKKGAGSVLDGIHLVQDYKLIVDPKSHNIQKELKMYVWDDKQIEKPKKEWDDALDALRYAVMALTREKEFEVW